MRSIGPRIALGLLGGLILFALPLYAGEDDASRDSKVLAAAARAGKARAFLSLVVLTDLDETIDKQGPYTLFVPIDAAFDRFSPSRFKSLRKDSARELKALIGYHIVPGRLTAADLAAEPRPRTLTGRKLTIAANDRGVAVNDGTIIQADIACGNGIVHLVDRVLTRPPEDLVVEAEASGRFSVFLQALFRAGLLDSLRNGGPVTLLAPTDEAIERYGSRAWKRLSSDSARMRAFLDGHLVSGGVSARELLSRSSIRTTAGRTLNCRIVGGRLNVDEARVVASDIEASNGLIHGVDAVLAVPEGHDK